MTKTIDRFELNVNGEKLSEMTDERRQQLGVEAENRNTNDWQVKADGRTLSEMNLAELMELEVHDPFYSAIKRAEVSGQSPLEAKVDGTKISQMTKTELERYADAMAIAGAVNMLISRTIHQRTT